MSERHIRSVIFGDGLVTVVYINYPDDIRNEGALMATHNISIDYHRGDYADEVEEVQHAALALLEDALDDFERTDPVDLTQTKDEHDDD